MLPLVGLAAAAFAEPPRAPAAEQRLTCELVAGGPADPRWAAEREKFGFAEPVVDQRGDLAFDPAGPTLTLFETGDRRHVLPAKRVGSRYVASTPTAAERPGGAAGGYLVSFVRDYDPATGRYRLWLQGGHDRWGQLDYDCAADPADADEPADDADAGDGKPA